MSNTAAATPMNTLVDLRLRYVPVPIVAFPEQDCNFIGSVCEWGHQVRYSVAIEMPNSDRIDRCAQEVIDVGLKCPVAERSITTRLDRLIVDAYGLEEQALGWYYCADNFIVDSCFADVVLAQLGHVVLDSKAC
jgi:hypothetical protein